MSLMMTRSAQIKREIASRAVILDDQGQMVETPNTDAAMEQGVEAPVPAPAENQNTDAAASTDDAAPTTVTNEGEESPAPAPEAESKVDDNGTVTETIHLNNGIRGNPTFKELPNGTGFYVQNLKY